MAHDFQTLARLDELLGIEILQFTAELNRKIGTQRFGERCDPAPALQ
jgi:hypothetical protein